MNIIRDNDLGGIAMIPLFCDWHIYRCNVKNCTDEPTTIITQLQDDLPAVGMCEKHYQEANQPDGAKFTFVFDTFDAFKFNKEKRETEANPK